MPTLPPERLQREREEAARVEREREEQEREEQELQAIQERLDRSREMLRDLPDVAEENASTGMTLEEYKKRKVMLAARQLEALLFEEGKTWREVLREISIQIQVQKYLDEIGVTWQEVEPLLYKDAE